MSGTDAAGQPADHGRLGEQLAAAHLREHGLRVLESRLRTRHGEIDLLCRTGRCYVAVEVKTRSRMAAPERAVTDAQRARLHRALRALAGVLRPRPLELRVDVVAVRLADPPEIRWFQGKPFSP